MKVVGALSFGAFSCLLGLTPAWGSSTIETKVVSESRVCGRGDQRILPSPDLKNVAVYQISRDLREVWSISRSLGFQIFTVPQSKDSEDTLLSGINVAAYNRVGSEAAVTGVFPVRWDRATGRLLFFAGKTEAVAFDPKTGLAGDHQLRDPLWTEGPIFALSHGREDFFLDHRNVKVLQTVLADGNPIRLSLTVSADKVAALVFRLGNNHQLIAYDRVGRWKTGIPLAFAHAPLLDPSRRSVLYLGKQGGYKHLLPFALPLIDLENGRAAGRFGLDKIELLNGKVVDLESLYNDIVTIKDAKKSGSSIFVLTETVSGQDLVRVAAGGVDIFHICRKSRIGDELVNGSKYSMSQRVSRKVIQFPKSSKARETLAFGMLYEPQIANGKLIVYFHGGPAISQLDQTVPSMVSEFAAKGVSVLAVEYSGMIGGDLGLSRQLPERGYGAISNDVDAVTDWVRQSKFGSVYLYGGSFGGVPALDAALRYPSVYRHVFFVVPLLKLRSFEDAVRRVEVPGRLATPVDRQMDFEYLVYGGPRGRSAFSSSLAESLGRLEPSDHFSFYFGDNDPVSSSSDLPISFLNHPSVHVLKADHRLLGFGPFVAKDISMKMDLADP